MVEVRRKVPILGKSVIYQSNIGPISFKYRSISPTDIIGTNIIGTDILTDTLYRYLNKGLITDISLIYRDINYKGSGRAGHPCGLALRVRTHAVTATPPP
ncbi:hypothetical protein Hanom_Chr08g00721671 [Helianthus anomalus]